MSTYPTRNLIGSIEDPELKGSVSPSGQMTGRANVGDFFKGDPGPQGPKGDPFKYSDFTPEQLEALRGPQGPQGPAGEDGQDYMLTPADKTEIAEQAAGLVKVPEGSYGKAIIDVVELPTENIREDVIYRVPIVKLACNRAFYEDATIHCVERLPEIGEPCTDVNMVYITGYYSLENDEIYGYITAEISSLFGIPVGWYTLSQLFAGIDVDWGGIIPSILDDPYDEAFRAVLSYNLYVYKNQWSYMPVLIRKPPMFDVEWDGDIGERFAIDLSLLGYDAGMYFVKVSDMSLNTENVIDGVYWYVDTGAYIRSDTIGFSNLDDTTYSGAFTIDDAILVVTRCDDLAASMGLPQGSIENGVYYTLTPEFRIARFATPERVETIDTKYIDTYSRRDIDDRIDYIASKIVEQSIGNAIGGSY